MCLCIVSDYMLYREMFFGCQFNIFISYQFRMFLCSCSFQLYCCKILSIDQESALVKEISICGTPFFFSLSCATAQSLHLALRCSDISIRSSFGLFLCTDVFIAYGFPRVSRLEIYVVWHCTVGFMQHFAISVGSLQYTHFA